MGTRTIIQRNGYAIDADTTLTFTTCGVCSIRHAIPTQLYDRCQRDRSEHWYCPNGHHLHFVETELDRERQRAQQLERRLASSRDTADRYRDNWERERRSAIAYKGHLTRIRNRIASGVCPVPGCKRSGFTQVLRHIATQHPDWLHDHPEINEGSA